jgi:hypothetical protein
MDLLGISRSIECKVRARAFGQIYSWLANSDLLIIRADRKEPLVVLPLWLASEVAAIAENETSKARRAAGPFLSRLIGEG